MANAEATFLGPSARDRHADLTIHIAYVKAGGAIGSATSGPSNWQAAEGCRSNMEMAYLGALRGDASFPQPEATFLSGALGWKIGRAHV